MHGKRKQYALAASAALLTFIVYLPALRNGFVNWDDDRYIYENLHIRSLGKEFFRWAFFDFYASNWHFLTWLSHAMDYALWGLNPSGHHFTSIFLHAVNTGLVFLLALKLFGIAGGGTSPTPPGSFLNDKTVRVAAGVTCLLFGLHPLHVESVAWVMERKDLLCALFFLLSVNAYLTYAGSRKSGNGGTGAQYLVALGFFVLALMSKPMAVTLPAVLLILDWYPLSRVRSLKEFRPAGIEKIPFVVLSLASSAITILAQKSGGAMSSLDVVPLSTRLLVAGTSLAGYLGKFLLPLDLIPFYPYPKDVSLLSLPSLMSIGLVFGITASCVTLARKQKFWVAAWGYYVVTLLPVLGFIQVGGQSMADRYTYLPSLGPFLIAGLLVAWLAAKIREAWGLNEHLSSAAAALIIFVPLSYLTVKQIQVWHDSISLWNHVLEQEPGLHIAHVNRGIAFMKGGQAEKALQDFNQVIATRPDAKAFYNRGLLMARMNLLPQAMSDYTSAITLNPLFYEAYNNRGVLFEKQGDYVKAFADYDAAISMRPSYFQAYVNRGLIFERSGQYEHALADFNQAIKLNPGHPDSYYNRALLLFERFGKLDGALGDFDRAIALNPRDPDAYYHRGLLFEKMGMREKAVADFDRTISIDPAYYQAYYRRGSLYQEAGQPEKAEKDLKIWKERSLKR